MKIVRSGVAVAVAQASGIGRQTPRWCPMPVSSKVLISGRSPSILISHVLPLRDEPKIQVRSSGGEIAVMRRP